MPNGRRGRVSGGAHESSDSARLLTLRPGARRKVTAQCHMLVDGDSVRYRVLRGSEAVAQEGLHLSKSGQSIIRLRQELLDAGVLRPAHGHLEFVQDYEFSNPSVAAGVILGRTANGYICWADMDGRLLDEFRPREQRGRGDHAGLAP